MKLLAAFAILLIGVNANILSVPSEVIPEGKDDDGLLEGIVKDVIDRISVFLVEAGYDPYRVDALGFQYKLPVTDLFAVNARAQNIALAGASNIVLHDIRYNPITFRLTFDVSLPRLSAAVGASALDLSFFGGDLNVNLGGSVALVGTRLTADVRISVLGGISIRTLELDFSLQAIESALTLRIQNVDYSQSINKLLGDTIPTAIEANRADINELLEYIVLQIAESILAIY